jgi:uncharacterized protein
VRDLTPLRTVKRTLTRALLVIASLALLLALCGAYARFIEPTWLRVRTLTLSPSPTLGVIHITDIHFAGDIQYLERVVATVNALEADLVCFTGDLIEDGIFLDGALRILSKVNKPMYGVPGNHDEWALASFDSIRATFRETGGDWLSAAPVLMRAKNVALLTRAGLSAPTPAGYRRILLEHSPEAVERMRGQRFDLILAGHTHGGQIRIPFIHRYALPFELGTYDRGLFHTPCGPLYVNPGIGTYYLKLRFRCRPEITVIRI